MINETPSAKNIQKDERVVEPEPECDVEPEGIEVPADAKTDKADGRSGDGLSWRERLEGMKGLLGFLAMIGLVAGVWSLVGSRSFNRMFDTLAGRYVSDCSKWMYFRPAIAVAIFGMTGHLTDNVGLALAVTAVYEVVLWCLRAKPLRSFRAAVVESLYLLSSDMGLLLLFWLFIIFAFLASGGPARSSGDGGGDKSESSSGDCGDCRDCDHGPGSIHCVGTPMAGYRCSHYRNCTGPK